MSPNIIFVRVKDSYIYLKNILKWAKENPELKEAVDYPFEKLINDLDRTTDNFLTVFEKNKQFILKKIEDISGFKWPPNMPVIYVYPIAFFNSFSHPLFLRVGGIKNSKFITRKNGHILGTLIHELCHNNFINLSIDREMNENLIHFIVINILNDIDSVYTKEYTDFHEKIGKKINIDILPEPIRTGRISIAYFYSKKRSSETTP